MRLNGVCKKVKRTLGTLGTRLSWAGQGRHAGLLRQGGDRASVATRAICCVTIGSKPGLTRTAGSLACPRPRLASARRRRTMPCPPRWFPRL